MTHGAAKYHDDQAAEWSEHYTKNGNDPSAREYAKQHSADAAAIRALADKPAPDPLLPGLEYALKAWDSEDIAGFDAVSFGAWLEHEIAARKGG